MYGHSYIRFEFKRPEHIQNCTEQDAPLSFASSSYVFPVQITSIILSNIPRRNFPGIPFNWHLTSKLVTRKFKPFLKTAPKREVKMKLKLAT